ncbi:hypothetical protein [Flavisolibacter nicotianae]|uniref:hypothetical protein n=1 Tax=Flavisolibacter nicotianae TaxID=2364882 RepID=UPI0013C45943|nr:hypothetical protein [Flavisolibacter nicotianae]
MLATYKLPRFLDYLYTNYHRYYELYVGRLMELFPSDEETENTLYIQDEEKTSKADNEEIYHLWMAFH